MKLNPLGSNQVLGTVYDPVNNSLRVTVVAGEGCGGDNRMEITGTRLKPVAVSSTTGIGIEGTCDELQFVKSDGGAISIAANPQIEAGMRVGQRLSIKGTSNSNTILLEDGSGIEINGNCLIQNGSQIDLMWDGTIWSEESRNDI